MMCACWEQKVIGEGEGVDATDVNEGGVRGAGIILAEDISVDKEALRASCKFRCS